MDSQLNILNAQTVKISHYDPRGEQCFLQFSHDMCGWNINEKNYNWWVTREKECHELFKKYGYNLHTGMWFCLIACKRRGWVGLANASIIFADNFTNQQSVCWPPMSELEVRRQILSAYCNHVIPVIYTLQVSEVCEQTLQEVLSATKSLQQIATVLKHEQRVLIQQVIVWLTACIKSLTKPGAVNNDNSISTGIITKTRNWKECILSGILGAIISFFMIFMLHEISDPTMLIASNNFWKGNPLFVHWQNSLKNEYHPYVDNQTSEQLNDQLNTLEKQLLASEQNKKSYLTISELKTAIYQMKDTLRGQDSMIENRLNYAEKMLQQQKPIPSSTLVALSGQISDINNRFLYLKSSSVK